MYKLPSLKPIILQKHKLVLYLTIHKPLLQPIHKPILHKSPKYKFIQPQLLISPIRYLTKIVNWHCSRFYHGFSAIYLERHLYVQTHHKHAWKIIYRTLLWGYTLIWKSNCQYRYHYNRFCSYIIFEWYLIYFA